MSRNHFKDSSLFNRLHVRAWICGILVSTLIPVNIFATGIGVDVQDVNADFNFSALDVTNYNNTLNLVFGSKDTDEKYMAITAIYRGLARAFGPAYTYQITSNTSGTPASYFETENLNRQLQSVTQNQWYINNNISGIRNYMDPISQVVSDIKTNTTNTAAATNAAITLLGDQVNIDWINTNITSIQSVSRNFDQSDPISPSYSNIGHGSFYFLLSDLGTVARNLNSVTYRVDLPLAFSNFRNDSYGFEIAIFNSYGDDVTDKFDIVDYFLLNNDYTLSVYMVGVPFPQGYPFTIRVTTENNIIYNPTTRYIYYLKDGTVDAMNFSNFLHLSNLSTNDVVDALNDLNVNVEVNDSINVTPIDLDVQIGINDFTEVNTISNKLRTWLSTGVGVSALIGALDQLDDSFFTLHNRNVIETINSGYTDFYD